jgi:D-sedoheptulose 7-phosphate isomerase
MTKRIAVTGADSVLGRSVAARLVSRGHVVVGLGVTRPESWPGSVEFVATDLRDETVVKRALDGVDVAIHGLDMRVAGLDTVLAALDGAARVVLVSAGDAEAQRAERTIAANDRTWVSIRTAVAMGRAFRRGGRLFTFGNGGSATDARLAAERFGRTSASSGELPAMCLTDAPAVLTALGNDVGFDLVFARTLDAIGRGGDLALGCSTSGGSHNVLRAFAVAHARDMLTIGLAGYDGGAMAESADLDHCLVVRSQSVHRIQEAQAALLADLARRVGAELEGEARP